MNLPPYFITTILDEVVSSVKEELELPNLRFDLGYIEEINAKTQHLNSDYSTQELKYPLIALVIPFTISKDITFDMFGKSLLRILIITSAPHGVYSKERYENYQTSLIYQIKDKFLEQLNDHEGIGYVSPYDKRSHDETFRPYWGEMQKSVFDDKVDVLELTGLEIYIENNLNC